MTIAAILLSSSYAGTAPQGEDVLVVPTHGLINFGEDNTATTNRHYTVTHADALDCIASTGWAWGCFLRLSQNNGAFNQYILSSGVLDANPSFNWFIGEATHASIPNEFGANLSDAGTDNILGEPGAGSVILNEEFLLVVQYNPGTGNAEMYFCRIGGAAALIATQTGPDGNIVAPSDWNWGRRSDGNTDRYYAEEMGGLFKVDRPLTTNEIASVAAGTSPAVLLGDDLAGWWAFMDGAQATEPDLTGNGNDLTRQGTWGAIPDLTLVGAWAGTETTGQTVADSFGNNANGVALERNLGSIVSGVSTASFAFDGSSSTMTAPNLAGYQTTAVSVGVHVQPDALPTNPGTNAILFDKSVGDPEGAINLELKVISGQLFPRVKVKHAGAYVTVDGDTAMAINTGHLINVAIHPVNGLTMWLNKVEVASNPTITTGWQDNSSALSWGSYQGGPSGPYDGVMKRFRIWNGALDQTAVDGEPNAATISHGGDGGDGDEITCINRTSGTLITTHANVNVTGGATPTINITQTGNPRFDMRNLNVRQRRISNESRSNFDPRTVVQIRVDQNGACYTGGTVRTNMPYSTHWNAAYPVNHEGCIHLRVQNSGVVINNILIERWRFHNCWDTIMTSRSSGLTPPTRITVKGCYISDARDDCVEFDQHQGFTLQDCLIDGTFSGPSSRLGGGGEGTGPCTAENCLIRLKPWPWNEPSSGGVSPWYNPGHNQFWKFESGSPTIHSRNCVYRVDQPCNVSTHDPFRSPENVGLWGDVVGNTICWFGQSTYGSYTSNWPIPNGGNGFTLLQGNQAVNFWNNARSQWLANHPGVDQTTYTDAL